MTLFTRSKALAVTLLLAVFLAGGAAGWALGTRFPHRRPPGRGPEAMAAFLYRRLDLSATQRDSVREIFARHHPEVRAIYSSLRPRMDSLRAVLRGEINAQLTPAQRERYARLLNEIEHQHERHEHRDSAMTKQGRP